MRSVTCSPLGGSARSSPPRGLHDCRVGEVGEHLCGSLPVLGGHRPSTVGRHVLLELAAQVFSSNAPAWLILSVGAEQANVLAEMTASGEEDQSRRRAVRRARREHSSKSALSSATDRAGPRCGPEGPTTARPSSSSCGDSVATRRSSTRRTRSCSLTTRSSRCRRRRLPQPSTAACDSRPGGAFAFSRTFGLYPGGCVACAVSVSLRQLGIRYEPAR